MVNSAALLPLCQNFLVSPTDRLTRYFLETRHELLRFLRRRTGQQAAEDALQEVWLNLRERSDPATWREPRAVLFTTAANLATDIARRNTVANKHICAEPLAADVECTRAGPEAQAEAADDLEQLQAALRELPQVCRDAFLLNRLEVMTHAEIAKRLGISKKSVQRYVERALRHCARALDP
jgi:RNA polymerase sigma-70 factor (ECF subfamily)